jgi:Uma2 family endonuclease
MLSDLQPSHIQHADQVRGLEELDFAVDPAPDLVIEVDISRSSIGKLPVFAAFQVAEVWQYRGASLTIHQLQGEDYAETSQSGVLPGFPIDEVSPLLARRAEVGETQLIRSFRDSLRRDPSRP